MENNQYKGFAYTKGSDKPTVVYGTSAQDILAKLNSYNVARTENDKFMACNIGSLNAETSKYEEYHRYDVATGKDISSVYLQIPPLKKEEFRKVIADLKAAGARFNVQKKRGISRLIRISRRFRTSVIKFLIIQLMILLGILKSRKNQIL